MCCVESKSMVLLWGRGEAGVEDVVVDAGGDVSSEKVAFCTEDTFFCPPEAFFCLREAFSGLPSLNECRPVSGDVSGCPYVVEAGDCGIDDEPLLDGWVEHGEHGIMGEVGVSRDGVAVSTGMQGVTIYPLARVYASLDGRDAVDLHISDVEA